MLRVERSMRRFVGAGVSQVTDRDFGGDWLSDSATGATRNEVDLQRREERPWIGTGINERRRSGDDDTTEQFTELMALDSDQRMVGEAK